MRALCLAGSVVVGCASGSGIDAAPASSAGAGYRVVVAPLNLASPLPIQLDTEQAQVFAELVRYYVEQKAHVAIIAEPDATRLWQASAASASDVDERGRLDAAARHFVRALGEHASFDLVVLPSLVQREIRLRNDRARWDGVERRLRVRDRSSPGTRTTLVWNRNIAALSLYVLFVTRDGEHVSEGRGGISLLEEAVLVPGGAEHATLLPTRKVVARPSYIREGVARALAAAPVP